MMINSKDRSRLALAALAAALATVPSAAPGQDFFTGNFPQQSGEGLYKGVCQGCHMPDAQGAVGAGAYPALAKDPRLQTPAYPALVVINGQKAMPQFGDALNDDQVANVVNYIRSSFGNHYADKITPAQVKALRPANPK
jgi:mono/diheme cytochrome c family protein